MDGKQIGIVPISQALDLAKEIGLDLVEIVPKADPPVCKLMDYGKYRFEQSKKEKESRKKQHVIRVKEIRFRPGIEDHDFQTKMSKLRKFLEEKNKVKATVMFRGRQMAHPEFGMKVLDIVRAELDGVATVVQEPKLEGRLMTMVLMPK